MQRRIIDVQEVPAGRFRREVVEKPAHPRLKASVGERILGRQAQRAEVERSRSYPQRRA
jgi:hypothetical protein